jgi:hypothetical protein
VGRSLEAITHRENVAALETIQGALRQDVPVKRFVPACLGLSAMLLASGCAAVESLDTKPNTGPCPVAGVLYDAAGWSIDGPERHENVGFTGCRGVQLLPLSGSTDRHKVEIDFAFKGPKARRFSRISGCDCPARQVVLAMKRPRERHLPPGTDIVRLTEKFRDSDPARQRDDCRHQFRGHCRLRPDAGTGGV